MNGKRDFFLKSFKQISQHTLAYPDIATQRTHRHKQKTHKELAFFLEGAILNSGSFFVVFSMCFTRVFFRFERFAREWEQIHLEMIPKVSQNQLKMDSRTPPATSKTRFRKRVLIQLSIYLPSLKKNTQNGHQNLKESTPERFFTLLKKH